MTLNGCHNRFGFRNRRYSDVSKYRTFPICATRNAVTHACLFVVSRGLTRADRVRRRARFAEFNAALSCREHEPGHSFTVVLE
jgi:hypothetical protein